MTDKELEKRIKQVYQRATTEMTEKMETFLDQFVKDIDEMSKKVESGEITERYFNKWKRDQIMQYNQWYETREKLSEVLLDADDVARDLIKGHLPTAMADGINRTFYELEQIHEVGDMGISFNLTEENTVKRLISENPRLLPVLGDESKIEKAVREGKINRWNQQHITAEVTQGIIQGESMQKIAQRMINVTGMNYRSAIRNARTATGGAYNAGRIEGMKQAEEKGVKMLKRWSAVFDDKTRDEHRLLDGVTIPIDEMFEIDGYELEYPRDPNGAPEMVYNCRCRLVSVPALIADKFDDIFDKDGMTTQGGLTYEEWKEGKQAETEKQTESRSKEKESDSAAQTIPDDQIIDKKELAENPNDFVAEKNADVPERFENKMPEIEKMTNTDIKAIFVNKDSYIFDDDYVEKYEKEQELYKKERTINEQTKVLENELKSETFVKQKSEWTLQDEIASMLGEKPVGYTERGEAIREELNGLSEQKKPIKEQLSDLESDLSKYDKKAYREELDEWDKENHPFEKGDINKEYQGFTTTMSIGGFDEDLKKGIGFIAEMSPDEYIDRIALEIFHDSKERTLNVDITSVKKYARMMADGTKFDMGYLDYENNGQEGRHRAIAARLLGIKKIPVYIRGK